MSGKKVVVGIRPERIFGPGKEAPPDAVRVQATVELVETLGDELIVHGRTGDSLLVFKLDPHHPPDIGAKIAVHFDLEAVHLFDAETEALIANGSMFAKT